VDLRISPPLNIIPSNLGILLCAGNHRKILLLTNHNPMIGKIKIYNQMSLGMLKFTTSAMKNEQIYGKLVLVF